MPAEEELAEVEVTRAMGQLAYKTRIKTCESTSWKNSNWR